MSKVYSKIKLIRQHHAFTQVHVAQNLSCSVPAYSKIETGVTDVTDSRLTKLAQLYGMRVSEIYEYGESYLSERLLTIQNLNAKVAEDDQTILDLQQKLIELYEKQHRSPGVKG